MNWKLVFQLSLFWAGDGNRHGVGHPFEDRAGVLAADFFSIAPT